MNIYIYQKNYENNIFIPLILVAKSRYDLFNDELALIKAGKMSTFKILHEGNLDVDVVYDLNFSPINHINYRDMLLLLLLNYADTFIN